MRAHARASLFFLIVGILPCLILWWAVSGDSFMHPYIWILAAWLLLGILSAVAVLLFEKHRRRNAQVFVIDEVTGVVMDKLLPTFAARDGASLLHKSIALAVTVTGRSPSGRATFISLGGEEVLVLLRE